MSREDWAREAGLSIGEMKNRALPKLRKCQCVTIRAMRLGDKKLLWMSITPEDLHEAKMETEVFEGLLEGAHYPGYEDFHQHYPYKLPK